MFLLAIDMGFFLFWNMGCQVSLDNEKLKWFIVELTAGGPGVRRLNNVSLLITCPLHVICTMAPPS
jgi:hypothetical protein